jgi:hypothetical protein
VLSCRCELTCILLTSGRKGLKIFRLHTGIDGEP